jgi:hypothetical protein
MTTLAVATDGLPIYDAAGQPLYRTPMGAVADAAGNLVDVNPANGFHVMMKEMTSYNRLK